jgi:DNA-directed RNA polymerase specialized sigma24 family protein
MAVSKKTKDLIDRLIANISAYPNCDMHQLGKDIYDVVDWSLRNHLVGATAFYKEDIRQECALAIWRKIREGKIHYVDRRIIGFLQLVTVNTMKTHIAKISRRQNVLNSGELPNTLSTPFNFSILLLEE